MSEPTYGQGVAGEESQVVAADLTDDRGDDWGDGADAPSTDVADEATDVADEATDVADEATDVADVPEAPRTGDPGVDEAVAALREAVGGPLDGQVTAYDAVHRALQDRLADVEG